jgi:hypothetical protein
LGVPSFSSELSIATSNSTRVGSYLIEVTGIEGGVLVTSTYLLTVTPATRNASGGPAINSLTGPVVVSGAMVGVALAVVVVSRASQLGRRLIRSGFTSHATHILPSHGWDIVPPDRPVM